jgi:hypothetical protein
MEDESKKENWDTLAGQLGADLPDSPETPELPEKRAQTEPAEASVQLPAEPLRPGPSGWDSLAEEFGIATPEPADMPEPDETPETSPSESLAENPQPPNSTVTSQSVSESPASVAEKSVAKDTPPAGADVASNEDSSFGAGISSPVDDWSSVAADLEPTPPALAETGSSESADPQLGHDQTPTTEIPAAESVAPPDQSFEPSDAGADAEMPHQSTDEATEPPPAADEGRTTSFWESIFGPRQETPLPEGSPQDTPTPEVVETTTPQKKEVVSDQPGKEVLVDDPTDRGRGDAEADRPRRRPRRRRSRSDKSAQPQSPSPPPKATDSRATEVADDSEDDSEDDRTVVSPGETDSKPRSSKAKPPSHRNIPAWEDAMAFIVDGNLQTRTERQQTTPRAGGRGRPRGRRKKKS